MPTALEIDVLNHYPSGGAVRPATIQTGADNNRFPKPYRSANLPAWQTNIIEGFPLLYRSEANVGFPDYCHLDFGFQVDEKWAMLLGQMSEFGTRLIQTLRSTGSQRDARIAVVRVRENQGSLHIQANDNLRDPYREIWRALLANCSEAAPEVALPRAV